MRFTLITSITTMAVLTVAAPHPTWGLGAGMAIPITKRSRLVKTDKSVDIDALNAEAASTKAKIFRGFDNFKKNTGILHPAAPKRTQKRGTNAVALTADNTSLWYGTVSVGTPAINFTVDFDTGSTDFVLPGPNCTSNCNGHTIYDPISSSTSVDLGATFSIPYNDNSSVSGELYNDTVTVAGLTATGQTFGVAAIYSAGFAKNIFPPDGLMGMAFQSISKYNASPVFQTLVSEGQTQNPVFSFKLAANGSELYLGGANSALYTGNFTYTPVTKEGYWEINMDAIEGNGQTVMTNIDSVIDTGTTLIIGIPSQVAGFYAALNGTEVVSNTPGYYYYTFPCDSFPSVSFTFKNTSFSIPASVLNLGPVSSNSTDCVSGIIGEDTLPFWIIGDLFLQNVYTTFDVGKLQVGFAQLA